MDNTDYKYTCNDYRTEMMLLGLNRRLNEEGLSEVERKVIIEEIKKLESKLGMD